MPLLTTSYLLFHSHSVEIYAFSAKERDTETGLSYFGARYYSSDLSIWLSVDPMSGKYPHQSGYVYCGNNPIMVVDPNGEDEYFNEYGFYLGSDNSESNDVRMIKQDDWEIFREFNDEKQEFIICPEYGHTVGKRISESDPDIFSDEAILNVYQYYGSKDFEINSIKDVADYGEIKGAPSKFSMTYNNTDKNVYIPVSQNRHKKLMDNFYNISSTFNHEKGHQLDTKTSLTNKPERELNAYNYQMKNESVWKHTTEAYKTAQRRAVEHWKKESKNR